MREECEVSGRRGVRFDPNSFPSAEGRALCQHPPGHLSARVTEKVFLGWGRRQMSNFPLPTGSWICSVSSRSSRSGIVSESGVSSYCKCNATANGTQALQTLCGLR